MFADASNADILRQYESYALEFDRFGRGEVLAASSCSICRGGSQCEICQLYKYYRSEIEDMPNGIGGRRRRLKSIDYQLTEANKPVLNMPEVNRKRRPSRWELWKKKMFGCFYADEEVAPEEAPVQLSVRQKKIAADKKPEFVAPTSMIINTNLKKLGDVSDTVSLGSSVGASIITRKAADSSKLNGVSFVDNNSSVDGTKSEGKYTVGGGKYSIGDTTASGGVVKNPFPKSMGLLVDESKEMVQITKDRKVAEEKEAKRRKNPLKNKDLSTL